MADIRQRLAAVESKRTEQAKADAALQPTFRCRAVEGRVQCKESFITDRAEYPSSQHDKQTAAHSPAAA
jgi:hypothetical protein